MLQTVTNPPRRLLLGPGPSTVHDRILAAIAKPTVGHMDRHFFDMMLEIQKLLRYAFQTDNKLTIPISGPGSLGMEACFVNLLEPGDQVIVCVNGVFGARMADIAARCGAMVTRVKNEWGEQVSLNMLNSALKNTPNVKLVAAVHAETSTGVCSDVQAIAALANQYDALTLIDVVTSIAGSEFKMDEWGVDAAYTGSQKCLSAPPGLSPISMSDRALSVIKNRKTKVASWFLDLTMLLNYWGDEQSERLYHHTAPVNAMYGLYESLKMLEEEGLNNAWARHAENGQSLVAGLKELGLELAVDAAVSLPQLIPVRIPEGVNDVAVRTILLEDYEIEIGAGLGKFNGNLWRIGLMGNSSRKKNIDLVLKALSCIIRSD